MTPRDNLYRLLDADLLRRLMQRTGSGQRITVRELATAAGCASGTIGDLRSGAKECVTVDTAHAMCRVIGVDVLVLFAPVGRAVPAPADEFAPATVKALV